MSDYVKIPRGLLEELSQIWEKIVVSSEVIDGEDPVDPTPVPDPPSPMFPHNLIWISPSMGHDSNDGMSAASAVKTWGRVVEMIDPGLPNKVMVRPGLYTDTIGFNNISTVDTPLYLCAEIPGTAVFDNMEQEQQNWQAIGNGIWKRSTVNSGDLGPWCGYYFEPGEEVTFLPRYTSLNDLKDAKLGNYRMPKYGFVKQGSQIYLRLPNGVDANKKLVYLTKSFSKTFMSFKSSPGVIINGIAFSGHGAGRALDFDEGSHSAWVQNCIFSHGREGMRLSDNSTYTWCQYGYPGMHKFSLDVALLNDGTSTPLFHYVKKYNVQSDNKGNAYLEGRIATSRADRSARGLSSAYNLVTECFDGHSIGQFEDASSYRDAGYRAFDDFFELESWRPQHTGKNLTLVEPFAMDCHTSFSHQDTVGQMRGPHTITRALVINPSQMINAAYIIKNLTSSEKLEPVKATYDHCFFHNPDGANNWGKNANFIYLDHPKGRWIDLSIHNSIIVIDHVDDWDKDWDPDCDYNVLVCKTDYPHLRGKNGMWFKSLDELKLETGGDYLIDGLTGKRIMDVMPTGQSPHVGKASDGMTVGPFEPGDLWPHRPLHKTFTDDIPEAWGKLIVER